MLSSFAALVVLSTALSARAFPPVINGDAPVPVHTAGTADFIGFNDTGTYLLRNSMRPGIQGIHASEMFSSPAWPNNNTVRTVGDTRGQGLADIVGFGADGVWVAKNNDDGSFATAQNTVKWFGSDDAAGGWSVDRNPRFLANVRGVDGRGDPRFGAVDIVGFGDAGVWVAVNNEDGTGGFHPAGIALSAFGYNQGWRVDQHPRFLADVYGDGRLDIVAFGNDTVYVAKNTGGGTFAEPIAALNQSFTPAAFWDVSKHPRFLADLTGSGRNDIVGFAYGGVDVSLSNGNGTFARAQRVLSSFGHDQGWRVQYHPRFVVDVNKDGFADIVGFGETSVFVSFGVGDGTFEEPTIVLNGSFTQRGGGWQVGRHPRLLADLDGDGAPEIIGFGEENTYVSWNDGKGAFGATMLMVPTFGYRAGQWGSDSVRYVTNMFSY